ncbi:MAG: 5-(carboxyamino)imidazole ribonucleotide mutase [Bdellovibrionales bacterium RIFCSPHIGHO2_01_FULL_40_29]|nr:MAG: 5-(carboxyamino)imidazole ribonucleotide mutase [Bdellovibrionales bacterium RIFCSPHIGHO2_01_FULL_40_29]OFZ32376.1 MAG: 5-(carboxyamino)imidazole ribonucleotide mutase [Bdellovibrionales bacterium RIFCSPHIGHO2_02_FULL_40_15]
MSLSKKPLVAIIMGSKTDLKVMQAAEDALTEFKISFITKIVSAHRTPEEMFDFSKKAHLQGIEVIIAGAGGAAHLPGMVACLTPLPVIGVPVTVGGLKGIDALLSIAQMPKGVPVATVAVDNAYNAGLLAVRILGLKNINLSKKIESHQKKQKLKVKSMNAELKKKKK